MEVQLQNLPGESSYKNIYPNIDLRYYTDNGQLKYDLVVHPGGDPNNIVMKYKGADKLTVKSGKITNSYISWRCKGNRFRILISFQKTETKTRMLVCGRSRH